MTPRPAAFRRALLAWYDAHRRDLPWRESNEFYRVWISEIMLQQTRVEAVIPYYRRFLTRFPNVGALAAAPEKDVLAAWSGLGYYSRARNLHRAAKRVAERGEPRSREEILELAGVGDYTSAALASISLGFPHAAVDGNVLRVVSRLFNDASEIGASSTRRRFAEFAAKLLDRQRPGDFNQAMMELGATVCTPRAPDCGGCPVAKLCAARAAGTEQELPVKLLKQQRRAVVLDIVLLVEEGRVFLVERSASERRMAGFWELPEKKHLPKFRGKVRGEFRHQIVGDRFRVRVWQSRGATCEDGPKGRWVGLSGLGELPLSTIARKAIALAAV